MEEKKKQIFYPREYRHMRNTPGYDVLEFCGTLLPFLLILWRGYSWFSLQLSELAKRMLKSFFGVEAAIEKNDSLSFFGSVFYVDTAGRKPGFTMCLILFIVALFMFIVILQIFEQYKPFMIYIGIFLSILLISDVFFIFFGDKFPYTLGTYANIYMVQQVVLWASIAFVTVVALSILPGIHGSAILSFWAIVIYSVIYGSVRYIIFVVFLYWATNVFMAPLYFMFGIFLDFMYVVAIYAIYARKISEKFNQRKEIATWEWS